MEYNQLYADVRIASKSGNQISGFCPLHDDRNPSFSYNIRTGLFKCFSGCGEGDAADYAKLKGLDPKPYYKGSIHKPSNSCNGFKGANTEPIKVSVALELNNADKKKALEYHKYLMDNYESLIGTWQIDKKTIKKLYIGYDTESKQFTFLFRGIEDKAFNLQHHHGKCIKGHELGRLYPGHLLKDYNPELPLIFAEGCKDVATLIHKRFNAVTCGAGAKSIPKDLYALNSFKEIILLFDKDKTGQEGSYALAKEMNKQLPNSKVLIAKWGNDKPDKWDVSDHFAQGIDEGDLLDEFDQILNDAKEYTSPIKGFKTLNALQFEKADFIKPSPIIDEILIEGGAGTIAGSDGVGKSILALQLALSCALGVPFLDYPVKRPVKVLLIQFELENGDLQERYLRMKAWFLSNYPNAPGDLESNLEIMIVRQETKMFIDQWGQIEETVKENADTDVLIIDNLYTSTNVDVSNNKELTPLLGRMTEIRRKYVLALLLINHHIKGNAEIKRLNKDMIRGGKSFTDWLTNAVQVAESSLNQDLRVFKITKIRSGEGLTRGIPQALRFDSDNFVFHRLTTIEREELHFIEPKTKPEFEAIRKIRPYADKDLIFTSGQFEAVIDEMHYSRKTAYNWIKKLKKWKAIEDLGYGKYKILESELDKYDEH